MANLKFLCIFLLALTTLPAQILCDAEEQENYAVELDSDSFDAAIEKNNHFVMFFAPWCGHCKRLHPMWEQLAGLMNVKDSKVVIAKVDCTQHQELCLKHEVTGYPTLRFFKLGEKESVKFKGTRDLPAITEFINLQMTDKQDVGTPTEPPKEDVEKNMVILTESNFAKHVSSGNHFVKFYAPWCSHCQHLAPIWEDLANTLENVSTVSISKIDCTQYRSICQDFDVKGYPTLLWIEDGKKIEKYSGKRDLETLKGFVEKMLGATEQVTESPKETSETDNQKVLQLNSNNFKEAIESGVNFVKFYAPWCGHCQKLSPTWDQLAEHYHASGKSVKISKVDCTAPESKDLCVEEQVKGYPTLFAYKEGEKLSEYEGGRSLDSLQTYINKLLGHDEL